MPFSTSTRIENDNELFQQSSIYGSPYGVFTCLVRVIIPSVEPGVVKLPAAIPAIASFGLAADEAGRPESPERTSLQYSAIPTAQRRRDKGAGW